METQEEKRINRMMSRIRPCVDCGQAFYANSPAQKRCETCRSAHNAVMTVKAARIRRDRKLEKIREKCDMINLKKAAKAKAVTVPAHRCPYCGKMTCTPYCRACRYEGFDNVHAMFGYTNGWDAKPHQKVAVMTGWRGRRVCGTIRPSFGSAV